MSVTMLSSAVFAMLCPDCPPQRAARDLVFDNMFTQHALIALLPFATVTVVVYVITRGLGRDERDVRGAA